MGGNRCDTAGIHKWLVLASAFVSLVLQDGFMMSVGSLFVAIIEEYDTTRAEAALVQSTMMGAFLGLGVLSGGLIKRFGPLKAGLAASGLGTVGSLASYFASSVSYLIVSIGVLAGFGLSLLYISASTITEDHFEGRVKLVVLSALTCGSGVGGLAYPYLLPYLNNVYGLNWTFLIVGAVICNNIVMCLLWSRRNKLGLFSKDMISNDGISSKIALEYATYKASDSENNIITVTTIESFKILTKNSAFTIFNLALAISCPTYVLFLIFVVDMFAGKGYTESDSSLGLVIWNIFNIIGRLSPGYIMQIPKFPDMGVLIISSFMCSLAFLLIGLISNLTLMYLCCAVVGLCYGMFVAMYSVGSLRLVGREHMPTAIGMLFTLSGVTCTVVGPVTGQARDRTNSYAIPIYSAAGCLMFSCFLFFVVHVMQRNRNQREYYGG